MQDYGVTSSTALLATASPSRGGRACVEVDVKSLPQARYLDKDLAQLTTRIGHLEIPAVSNNQLAAAAFAASL